MLTPVYHLQIANAFFEHINLRQGLENDSPEKKQDILQAWCVLCHSSQVWEYTSDVLQIMFVIRWECFQKYHSLSNH